MDPSSERTQASLYLDGRAALSREQSRGQSEESGGQNRFPLTRFCDVCFVCVPAAKFASKGHMIPLTSVKTGPAACTRPTADAKGHKAYVVKQTHFGAILLIIAALMLLVGALVREIPANSLSMMLNVSPD